MEQFSLYLSFSRFLSLCQSDASVTLNKLISRTCNIFSVILRRCSEVTFFIVIFSKIPFKYWRLFQRTDARVPMPSQTYAWLKLALIQKMQSNKGKYKKERIFPRKQIVQTFSWKYIRFQARQNTAILSYSTGYTYYIKCIYSNI